MTGRKLKIKFNDPTDSNIGKWIDDSLEELVNNIKSGMRRTDVVGPEFKSLGSPEKPFYISMRLVGQIDKNLILEKLNNIIQSNQTFFLNELLEIFITHIEMPVGFGNPNGEHAVYLDWLKLHHRSIINVKADDNLCFAYAMVVATRFATTPLGITRLRNKLKRNELEEIHAMTLSFCVETGIDLTNGATIEDTRKVQLFFRNE
jgi:hypothetical protein